MADGHGGARPGAGRKSTRERFGAEVASAEELLAAELRGVVVRLLELTRGTERVEEEFAPAGTVTVDDVEWGEKGPVRVKKPAFPDKDAEEMVLVKRRVIHGGPDREALTYAADRILGKPTASVETDLTSGGEPVQVVFYIPDNGRDPRPAADDGAETDPDAGAGDDGILSVVSADEPPDDDGADA